jgi:hypothetical protein
VSANLHYPRLIKTTNHKLPKTSLFSNLAIRKAT